MGSSKYFFGCFNGCLGFISLIIFIILSIAFWPYWWGKISIVIILGLMFLIVYLAVKNNSST